MIGSRPGRYTDAGMDGPAELERTALSEQASHQASAAEQMQLLADRPSFCHRTIEGRIRPEAKKLLGRPMSTGEQCSAAQNQERHASARC